MYFLSCFCRAPKLMASYNYENRKGSGKKLKVHFDLPKDGENPIDHHKKHSSASISSQTSLDSDDNMENLEESSNVGGSSPTWSFHSGTFMQSPTPQSMSPNPNPNFEYDPSRIPSSVFASKPTSPMEWSVQSNESLFSLHLGNYSFSKDQFFAFSSKSGEFPKNSDFIGTSTTLPPVQEVNHNNDKNEVGKERHSMSPDSSHGSIDALDETTNLPLGKDNIKTSKEKIDLVLKDDDHDKTKTSTNVNTYTLDKIHEDHNKAVVVPSEEPKNYATNVSYRSVESDMSNHSFQFPM